jgi:cell division protein FtsI (penicillin-binding protein 3)
VTVTRTTVKRTDAKGAATSGAKGRGSKAATPSRAQPSGVGSTATARERIAQAKAGKTPDPRPGDLRVRRVRVTTAPAGVVRVSSNPRRPAAPTTERQRSARATARTAANAAAAPTARRSASSGAAPRGVTRATATASITAAAAGIATAARRSAKPGGRPTGSAGAGRREDLGAPRGTTARRMAIGTFDVASRAAHGTADYFARTTPSHERRRPTPDNVTRARTGRRLVLTILCLALLFTLIIYKLADLQVLNPEGYTAFGESQRMRTETLAADRGAILDRNGTPLALSTPQKSVFVDPQVVANAVSEDAADAKKPAAEKFQVHGAAVLVAEALGLDVADVEKKLTADNRFSYLARQITDEQAAKIRELKEHKQTIPPGPNDKSAKTRTVDLLPGIEFVDEPKRFVPSGELAKSIIGQVDIDGQGISGLEKMYGKELTGTPGKVVLERSQAGRTIAPADTHVIPAVKGRDVQLTIDRSMQFDTERILGEQVRDAGAKGGIAIVSKPDTGEVLAMANVVADPKTGEISVDGNNAALTTAYEPGSVMKVITAAGAIENGKVTPETQIPIPENLPVCDANFSDAEPHGNVVWPVSEVMAQSSNIGTIKMGQMIGKDEIYRYMKSFGIAERTSLDFPNEQAGSLMTPDKWWCSSNGSIPIGQGVAVTPMQMLQTYNVIANGGVYVAPKLVAATVDGDGVRHPTATDEGHRVISRDTSNKMNLMLRSVVKKGTGTAAAIPGYNPAGKTGTARKPQPNGGYVGADGVVHYQATFVGFVPAENPSLSIIVIIDDPSKQGIFGGVVAAPAFAKIGEAALREFAVPPPSVDVITGGGKVDQSTNDPSKLATTTTTSPDGTTGPTAQHTADGRIRGVAAGEVTTTTAAPGSATGSYPGSGATASTLPGVATGNGTGTPTTVYRPPTTYPGQVPATAPKTTTPVTTARPATTIKKP